MSSYGQHQQAHNAAPVSMAQQQAASFSSSQSQPVMNKPFVGNQGGFAAPATTTWNPSAQAAQSGPPASLSSNIAHAHASSTSSSSSGATGPSNIVTTQAAAARVDLPIPDVVALLGQVIAAVTGMLVLRRCDCFHSIIIVL